MGHERTTRTERPDSVNVPQGFKEVVAGWQPIETAPKDGTWILAHGKAYPELQERGNWFTADTKKPRVPFTMIIKWIDGWYDREVELGNGTYTKERTCGYAYWWPEPHAFHPTHWMPLPEPPRS